MANLNLSTIASVPFRFFKAVEGEVSSAPFGEVARDYLELCSPVLTHLAISMANGFYYCSGWSSEGGFKATGGWNKAADYDRRYAGEKLADLTGIAEYAARQILEQVAAYQVSNRVAFGFEGYDSGSSNPEIIWNLDHVQIPNFAGLLWYQGTPNCTDYYSPCSSDESRWLAWQAARCFVHFHQGSKEAVRWWLGARRGEQYFSSARLDKAEKKFFGQIMTGGTHPKRLRFWRFVLLLFTGKTPRDIAVMEKERGIPHRMWWNVTYK